MSEEPAFDEILDAAAVLDDLPDLARVDAWASSVLGVWAEDADASAIDDHFLEWLAASEHPRAAPLRAAVERVVAPVDGAVTAERAWSVQRGHTRSVGIGFRASDDSRHSLLADIVDGRLAGLIVAPGPDELFDEAEDIVNPEPLGVGEAAAEMVAAWDELVANRTTPDESVWTNGALGRARLGFLVPDGVSQFGRPFEVADFEPDIDRGELAELNAWALSVLDGAGVGVGTGPPEGVADPLIAERSRQYPAAEREAFAALEWADWLGVVLGLARSAPGTAIEPAMLVDLVNQCPEVTSQIPRKDRPYYEWAWSMVVPMWREAGVIGDGNELLAGGAERLVAALRRAWAPEPGC